MKINQIGNGRSFNGYKTSVDEDAMKYIFKQYREDLRKSFTPDDDTIEYISEEHKNMKWFSNKINSDIIDIRFDKALDGSAKDPMYVILNKRQRQIPIYGIFRLADDEKFTTLRKILGHLI